MPKSAMPSSRIRRNFFNSLLRQKDREDGRVALEMAPAEMAPGGKAPAKAVMGLVDRAGTAAARRAVAEAAARAESALREMDRRAAAVSLEGLVLAAE